MQGVIFLIVSLAVMSAKADISEELSPPPLPSFQPLPTEDEMNIETQSIPEEFKLIPEAPLSPRAAPMSVVETFFKDQTELPKSNGHIHGDAMMTPGGRLLNDDHHKPNYAYTYSVKDEEAGLDFGHEEKREGMETNGKYFVLLPDGRKLVVRYKADAHGYRPILSYE